VHDKSKSKKGKEQIKAKYGNDFRNFVDFISEIRLKSLCPREKLTVSEWADKYRELPRIAALPGKWRTSVTPYLKDIQDSFNNPFVRHIVVMSSAQVGKTSAIENMIGYSIDLDPSSIMLVMPTELDYESFSKERFAPFVSDTKVLHVKISDAKSKSTSNTIREKHFAGGFITMAGANSPASLASKAISKLFLDEVDRYPKSAGSEGDPVSLATKRTQTFRNAKIVMCSTPTVKGESRIEVAYFAGTRGKYCYKCPSCGSYQSITWSSVKFERDDNLEVTEVNCVCNSCGVLYDEYEWKSSNQKWIHERELKANKTISFHLNEFSSPWKSWKEIVIDFLEAKKGGREQLQVWTNTSLGETWEESGENLEDSVLIDRIEHYDGEVPSGVLILTAGVDTQDDRIECEVVGWSRGFESWGIAYKRFYGDTSKPDVWKELSNYLSQDFFYSDGKSIKITASFVDSGGHRTSEVYKFCYDNRNSNVYAIKGYGGSGVPIIKSYSEVKVNNTSQIYLFSIGVNTGKSDIFSFLKTEDIGSGYCHFPNNPESGYDSIYFAGLTSERRVLRHNKGIPRFEWKKVSSNARNEPFDCRNYAYAAVYFLNPKWDILECLSDNASINENRVKRSKRGCANI